MSMCRNINHYIDFTKQCSFALIPSKSPIENYYNAWNADPAYVYVSPTIWVCFRLDVNPRPRSFYFLSFQKLKWNEK